MDEDPAVGSATTVEVRDSVLLRVVTSSEEPVEAIAEGTVKLDDGDTLIVVHDADPIEEVDSKKIPDAESEDVLSAVGAAVELVTGELVIATESTVVPEADFELPVEVARVWETEVIDGEAGNAVALVVCTAVAVIVLPAPLVIQRLGSGNDRTVVISAGAMPKLE